MNVRRSLSPSERRVFDFVEAIARSARGVTISDEVATQTKLSRDRAAKLLRRVERAGLIKSERKGRLLVWSVVEVATSRAARTFYVNPNGETSTTLAHVERENGVPG
jgi:DNA-binding IclR family transcriptional regulator